MTKMLKRIGLPLLYGVCWPYIMLLRLIYRVRVGDGCGPTMGLDDNVIISARVSEQWVAWALGIWVMGLIATAIQLANTSSGVVQRVAVLALCLVAVGGAHWLDVQSVQQEEVSGG